MLLEGYYSWPKLLNTSAIHTLSKVSQKYVGFHYISFETWRGIA
jgi:hypothetical protein